MKILLVGNPTCGDRGDGAILRGLIDAINPARSDVEMAIARRYPVSAGYQALANEGAIKQQVETAIAHQREVGNRIAEEILNVLG